MPHLTPFHDSKEHHSASDDCMDAVVDFTFSNGLPISFVECTQIHQLIQCLRIISPLYSLPYRKNVSGDLLDGIYQSAYDKMIELLLKQSKTFGKALFGDGATIKKVPLMNFLASSPNNPCPMCIA